MRIVIATDAWSPQINGVVTTLRNTIGELERKGHLVRVITAEHVATFPCPTYPEIRLAIAPGRHVRDTIEQFEPDAIHVATEGPIGLATRRHCLRTRRAFTTAYHTQFPEYVHARCRLPVALTYRWMRHFHGPSSMLMVPTREIYRRLQNRGFGNLAYWSRGVDTELFVPAPREREGHRRPIFLYAGRVAVEKNIGEFLRLDLPGTKWVVGDGPARRNLENAFPDVVFHGMKTGRDLARFYQQADVFVFPSRTDTFGLVMAEAMACGTPVAAFPVTGPADVVDHGVSGILHDDLRTAAVSALELDRSDVRGHALKFSWADATRQFLANLSPTRPIPEGPARSEAVNGWRTRTSPFNRSRGSGSR